MTYRCIFTFLKRETVLSVSIALATVSCFYITPDRRYASYFDLHTLTLLFSLMSVTSGLKSQGIFFRLGRILLAKVRNIRQVMLVLVSLCFFSSLLITNDVALITFVPFTFVVLEMLGREMCRALTLPIVCMQTIAANLGSMLTPIGNPQNLFLYAKSGMGLFEFMALTAPFFVLSFFLLLAWIFLFCRNKSAIGVMTLDLSSASDHAPDKIKTPLHIIILILCVLTVVGKLPYTLLLAITLSATLCFDAKALKDIDYSLLATFAALFIFIGNLGRSQTFSDSLSGTLAGHETLAAILASQIISNVPAAVLLSEFTKQTAPLIVGVNLGGLGTLIASMASLISFRQIARHEGDRKWKYLLIFSIANIIFLSILIAATEFMYPEFSILH